MQVIGDHISKGNLNKAYVKLSRPEVSKETRIVLHRHKDVYVRAATKEESKEFLKALAAKWSDIDRQVQESDLSVTSAPPGVVGVQVSICFDDNHRAIAKIAYNMLAVCKGSDFVLRDEFRPLREYIRGNEIVHDIPTDEKEPLVDKRFVGLIKHGDSPFIRTDSHIVVLAYSYPTLFAMVTLYSQFTYLVSMANIELSHPLTEAIEFSTDRSSFHRLTEMELFQRMPVPTPE